MMAIISLPITSTAMLIGVLLIVGLIAGAFGASLGVGGGVIMVPALLMVTVADQHVAEGTSLAVIVPTMIVAAATHSVAKRVEWRTAAYLTVGAAVGGWLGAGLALGTDVATLRKAFAVILLVAAARVLLVSSAGDGSRPT